MRKAFLLFTLIASLPFAGCATAHDYCVSHSDHYSSYGECYSERTARSARIRESFSHIGDRDNTVQAQYEKPVTCSTTVYGQTAYTNCN